MFQSIFYHSFNVPLYLTHICVTQVGFMREGRLLAEDSPAGLLCRKLWPWTLSIPWTDSIRQVILWLNISKLPGLLQSHCATSLEGVFLSLCQVAWIIVKRTQDVTKNYVQAETKCSSVVTSTESTNSLASLSHSKELLCRLTVQISAYFQQLGVESESTK